MAQTSIRGYYPVKRKREDHASIKRRKLTEDTRLDISVISEHSDPTSISLTQPEKVTTTQNKTKSVRRGTKAVTRKKVNTRKRKDEPSLQTLFDIIQKDREQASESADPSEKEKPLFTSDVSVTLENNVSNVQPPTQTEDSVPVTRTPESSPVKTRSQGLSRGAALLALSKQKSKASSRSRSSTTAVKTPQSSPMKNQPQALSRGAALVRLAQEKKTAKPSQEVDKTKRVTRIAARRKLLANPEAVELKLQDETRKQLSREEMVGKLYKLSAKELAKPTQVEENAATSKTLKQGKSVKTKSPKLREFSSFEFKSPVKKSQPPAYERFHGLAEPSAPTQSPTKQHDPEKLPLPYTYQLLVEKFRSTDTVTTMLQKRKEICTFSKLKKAVQGMTRKKFEKRSLAQMKTVFPSAYVFRQEKNIPGNYDHSEYAKYQLTIECNTTSEGAVDEDKIQLGPTALIKRRKVFQTNLAAIIKKHHKKFLAKLDPPLDISDDKVMRWHPAFPLDSVPEVEESELPKPPMTDTYMTAQDVLRATQGQLPSRVQTALSNVAASGAAKETKSEENKKKECLDADPLLKGVSSALLDKIRAKEAAKAELQITRDPLKEKQLEMMSRLPDFVRILRNYFVVEKKAVLPWDDVVQKLSDSHPSGLPTDRVEEHLACLSQLVPKWINVVNVRKRKYVKIDKKGDLKQVTTKLDDARKMVLTGSSL